jgi:hypothetical protein
MTDMVTPHAAIFADDNPHSHPLPDAHALAADPEFPSRELLMELRQAWTKDTSGLLRDVRLGEVNRLWCHAAAIWRNCYYGQEPFAQSDIDALGGAAA